MAGRQLVSSGAKWEDKVGYSRGVRVTTGTFDFIEIAGTTAPGNGAYEQTRHALQKIERALHQLGARFSDVTRTRMFVVDIDRDKEAVGRAHGEAFRAMKPAATMVQVSRLIEAELLVEIEVTAIKSFSHNSG